MEEKFAEAQQKLTREVEELQKNNQKLLYESDQLRERNQQLMDERDGQTDISPILKNFERQTKIN